MLKGADLSKILDEGYGDAGYNDPVPELDRPEQAGSKRPAARAAAATGPGAPAAAKPAAKAKTIPEPYARPAVLGAAPPPPEGVELEKYQVTQALDEAARQKGYKSVEEYNEYLQQSGAFKEEADAMNQMQLAPGIKKAPPYMPPGAYPGDRTKLGKEYEKEVEKLPEPEPQAETPDDRVDCKYIKQSETYGPGRPSDGNRIGYRLKEDGNIIEGELGSESLPWALEVAARRMKVGDVMDVLGRGEYAFADEEQFTPGTERRWWFELLSIGGQSLDKFKLDCDERVERANQLRLRGNEMFKQGRLSRAMDYYERGSTLMDVLEAEELGLPGHKDKRAAERNQRIWRCQQPLLLNWALILMKRGRWKEAERKCTEVLMDIEKECVKALFRRGQCNIHLGNPEQARADLRRAGELDTSIAKEVEREMKKVEAMLKAADKQDQGFARKVVDTFLKESDARTERPPVAEAPPPTPAPTDRLLSMLKAQELAAEQEGTDEDAYCRQREAIYNQFLRAGGPVAVADPDEG